MTETATREVEIDTIYRAVFDPATFTSQGTIDSGVLQGTTLWKGLGSTPHPAVDGTAVEGAVAYTGQLEITTERGGLTLINVGVMEPRGFGRVNGAHRVIAGTGLFEGATGDLFWYGHATNPEGTEGIMYVKGALNLKM